MTTRSTLNNQKILDKKLPKIFSGFKVKAKIGETIEINGNPIVIKEEWFRPKTKNIILNPMFLKAIDLFKNNEVSYGVSKNGEVIHYVLSEYAEEHLIIASAYNPSTAKINTLCKDSIKGEIKSSRPINGKDGDGLEVWVSIIAYILVNQGNEYKEIFDLLSKVIIEPPEKVVEEIYTLQQVIFDEIEDTDIPISFNDGTRCDSISKETIGMYIPTDINKGEFTVLVEKQDAINSNDTLVEEIMGKYPYPHSDKYLEHIPTKDDVGGYVVSKNLNLALTYITKAKERVFICFGPAGSGKSTFGEILAGVLGVPHGMLVGSYDTDKNAVTYSYMPNNDNPKTVTADMEKEIQLGLEFDVKGTVKHFTGLDVAEDINKYEANAIIHNHLISENMNSQKDFKLGYSQLLQFAGVPSVVEFAEANMVGYQATLTALNSFLDNNRKFVTDDGKVIERHKDSIVVFTLNIGYQGAKKITESILNRGTTKLFFDTPSDAEMIERLFSDQEVLEVMNLNNVERRISREMVKKMINCINYLRDYLSEQDIPAVLGYRDLKAWLKQWCSISDARLAAETSIIPSIALSSSNDDEEIREIMSDVRAKVHGKIKEGI